MRYLLLGTAALALSGCSFLGLGDNSKTDYNTYNPQTGYYGQPVAAVPRANSRCHSGNCLARWNLEGGVGPAFIVGGDAVTADQTNFNEATNFNQVSMDTAYDEGIRAELGGSYALAPNTKVSLLGHYEQADSAGAQDWGTIGGEQLTGALSDYKSYGGEIGLRQYFQPTNGVILNSVRPYVEGRLGVAKVEDIDIQGARLGDAAFSAVDVPFYKDSWVGTGAALVGVETPVARYMTIGLETGVRYSQGLRSDNSVLAPGTILAGTNNGGSRTTIPLTLRGRYRF
jgi:hypothetical protein